MCTSPGHDAGHRASCGGGDTHTAHREVGFEPPHCPSTGRHLSSPPKLCTTTHPTAPTANETSGLPTGGPSSPGGALCEITESAHAWRPETPRHERVVCLLDRIFASAGTRGWTTWRAGRQGRPWRDTVPPYFVSVGTRGRVAGTSDVPTQLCDLIQLQFNEFK